MILVDSDVLIEHLRGRTADRDWLVGARQSSGPLAISVLSLTEIAGGMRPPGRREVMYAGRILRSYDGKTTAEINDYIDQRTGVLAASLAKHAPGYVSLGFPDPRRLPRTPSATIASTA